MFELSQDLGVFLSLSETCRCCRAVATHDSIDSIGSVRQPQRRLLPKLVSGENFRMLSSLKILSARGYADGSQRIGKPIMKWQTHTSRRDDVVDPGSIRRCNLLSCVSSR